LIPAWYAAPPLSTVLMNTGELPLSVKPNPAPGPSRLTCTALKEEVHSKKLYKGYGQKSKYAGLP